MRRRWTKPGAAVNVPVYGALPAHGTRPGEFAFLQRKGQLYLYYWSGSEWIYHPPGREPALMWCLITGSDLATGDEQGPVFRLKNDLRLTTLEMNVKTAPVGSAIIIDIERSTDIASGWSSIFSSKPQVAASARIQSAGWLFSAKVIRKDTFVRLNIDQVGSTTAGKDTTVELFGRETGEP